VRKNIYTYILIFYNEDGTTIKYDRKTLWAPNISTFLLTTLAAEVNLQEGRFLLDGQTLNKAVSDVLIWDSKNKCL
jgi:hypothetical protein